MRDSHGGYCQPSAQRFSSQCEPKNVDIRPMSDGQRATARHCSRSTSRPGRPVQKSEPSMVPLEGNPSMNVDIDRMMWVSQHRRELEALTRSNQVSLIAGDRTKSRKLLDTLGEVFGSEPRSLTSAGLTPEAVTLTGALADELGGSYLLHDLECLCWQPWLNAEPLRFLRILARRNGVFAVWPGSVSDGVASFSAPGRRDHVSVSASGVTVLRPVATRFPDEAPFTLERIP